MHTHIFKGKLNQEQQSEMDRAFKDPLMFLNYPISFAREMGTFKHNIELATEVTTLFEVKDGRIIVVEYSWVTGHSCPQDLHVYLYKEDNIKQRKNKEKPKPPKRIDITSGRDATLYDREYNI